MYIICKLFVLNLILLVNHVMCKKYHNHTLYRVIPVVETQVEFLENVTEYYDINIWRPVTTVYKAVEFVIGPVHKETLLQEAKAKNLYLTTIIEDVQSAFDLQTVKPYIRRKLNTFDWENFYRLDDIYNWLRDIKHNYPDEIELDSIGKTFEGREILVARLVLKGSQLRSTVVVEGGIHAREWISPAFVTYMLFTLLHAPDSNDEVLKKIAYTYEFYFVPVLNPDGYEYTHKKDRLWRKNRSYGSGVDINRNFDASFGITDLGFSRLRYKTRCTTLWSTTLNHSLHWDSIEELFACKRTDTFAGEFANLSKFDENQFNATGVSFTHKAETYCGKNAFSELESSAMAAFLRSKSKNLEYYLAFHSYGQYIILPYAYSKQHSENYDEVIKIVKKAADEIKRKYNTQYTYGTAYDTVNYITSGVSGCWVKKALRVPYVITFELRDTGNRGFALFTRDIKPTCLETMDGIKSLLTPKTKIPRKLKGATDDVEQYSSNQNMGILLSKFILFCNFILLVGTF